MSNHRFKKVGPLSFINEELLRLNNGSLYRYLRQSSVEKNGKINFDGKLLLNFCSNDYLGISEELDLSRIQLSSSNMGGSGSSRLIAGNSSFFTQLERSVANLKGTESALIFSSGYMANVGVISSLIGRGDAVFSDRLNHASIVDGVKLSGAKHFRYNHNDASHLNSLLEKNKTFKTKLIVSESLFSMDGDIAPLQELTDLQKKYNAMLMIDEAHSGGIYGNCGAGLVNELQLVDHVDIQMGTFSKAYGSYGSYIAGGKNIIEYLINKARSFIYTTALPPHLIELNLNAIEIVKSDQYRRDQLRRNADYFRRELIKIGLNIGKSSSHIVPLILNDDNFTVEICEKLWQGGIAAIPIRPPTVPKGASRIRFSLLASHNRKDLEFCTSKIKEVLKK